MAIKDISDHWDLVVGLEIHAQINSQHKVFSYSKTAFAAAANEQVSIVDAAMPGTLPVFNVECLEKAIMTGISIDGTINQHSIFDRKNYFYPDLPQGYQITQMYQPIVTNGHIDVEVDNATKRVSINRIHIEQDAGKSMHNSATKQTLIDLNRSGIGLMEIVTEPCMTSIDEVKAFLRKLRVLLRYIDVCDGNMEEGSMRCDANVSIKPAQSSTLGTRVEIKNINSVNNVASAITYEAKRHISLLENNEKIQQETRLFDVNKGVTKAMRKKESLADYRYFPDPNLRHVRISEEYIDDVRTKMPEPYEQITARYAAMGLNSEEIRILLEDTYLNRYFNELLTANIAAKSAVNWIMIELFARMKEANITDIVDCKVSASNLIELLQILNSGKISGKIAKEVLSKMFTSGMTAAEIISRDNLVQISDDGEINSIVQQVLATCSSEVERYNNGEKKLLGFFVGEVMKKSRGKANPAAVNRILKELLTG